MRGGLLPSCGSRSLSWSNRAAPLRIQVVVLVTPSPAPWPPRPRLQEVRFPATSLV